MEKKYFKCYFCKTGNSYNVPIDQKGKECRCCQAYNYFYKSNIHNENNYNNNYYSNNNNNHNENNFNYKSNYYVSHHNSNNYNNNKNNKYNNITKYNFKKKKNKKYENNNNRRNQNTSNINLFNKTSNNFYNNQSNLPIYNPSNNFYEHNIWNQNENNRRRNEINNSSFNFIDRIIRNNNVNINNFRRNIYSRIELSNNINNKEDEKIKENNIVKYSWLKKEKLTQSKMDKKEDGYECSICLEVIKLNENINILKCGHIFHYKCIENLVDHHLNCCPNCRCDLKTGKEQIKNQNDNNNGLLHNEIFQYPLFIDDSNDDSYY